MLSLSLPPSLRRRFLTSEYEYNVRFFFTASSRAFSCYVTNNKGVLRILYVSVSSYGLINVIRWLGLSSVVYVCPVGLFRLSVFAWPKNTQKDQERERKKERRVFNQIIRVFHSLSPSSAQALVDSHYPTRRARPTNKRDSNHMRKRPNYETKMCQTTQNITVPHM